jgi:hypothetical protein
MCIAYTAHSTALRACDVPAKHTLLPLPLIAMLGSSIVVACFRRQFRPEKPSPLDCEFATHTIGISFSVSN